MSPRQARRERREAARQAKKLDLKKARLIDTAPEPAPVAPRWNPALEAEFPRDQQIRLNIMADQYALQFPASAPAPPIDPEQPPNGFVSEKISCRAAINRANAQHSTGPRTSEGKLASSRNSTRHGLASGVLLIPGEDAAAFENLLQALLDEHQPATSTEELLITEMAQSHWLIQRAVRLQTTCFNAAGEVNEKQLALFLRYQTTHQRAFYKAFDTLLRLKKEAACAHCGFVSRRRHASSEFARQNSPTTGFVSQNTPESLANQVANTAHPPRTQAA